MKSGPRPVVSIIIPCRNERRYIVECLESILENDHGPTTIEVLVVDGASDDGTRELLQNCVLRWPALDCFNNPLRTTPAALNIGIRHARANIIMRMDAHCRYPSTYVTALVEWLDRSGADNVGGICRTLPGADTQRARAIAIALSHPFGVGNSHFRIGTSSAKWVDTVPFGCYRRSVFDRIGFFDEDLLKNQDDEFNQRLINNGGRILLVPEVIVDYYARDSIGKVARMYYQYGYFKPLVARKLGRVGTFRQVIPAAFVLSVAITTALAPWLSVARSTLGVIMGAYLAVLSIVAAKESVRTGPGVSALLVATFPAIHFSYGVGSLRGIVDFFIRRLPGSPDPGGIPVSR